MAKAAAFDPNDPTKVLVWVRGAVAARVGYADVGSPEVAAKRVAPAAHLNRLGFTVRDYDALQQDIKALWGVELIVPTNARVQEVADAIVAGVQGRAA